MSDKLLTIVVPVYNTEQYLPKCLDSLIVEDFLNVLEVLIVIDGSPDNAINIAKKYEEKYPQTFRVIDKENAGYGSAVNKGLELATGKYFRLLDSDDWFDKDAFRTFLQRLQILEVDLVMTDYVMEYVFENRTELKDLKKLPKGTHKIQDISNKFLSDSNILEMHRTTYKTELFKKLNIVLPEKTLYTDTIIAVVPMLLVKTFCYEPVPLYRYFIGRDGQSVAVASYIKNREHLARVLKYTYNRFEEKKQGLLPILKECILSKIKSVFSFNYFILSRLDFNKSKEELKNWNDFVKQTDDFSFFKQEKVIKLYSLLPFFVYWNLLHCCRKVKNIIKAN